MADDNSHSSHIRSQLHLCIVNAKTQLEKARKLKEVREFNKKEEDAIKLAKAKEAKIDLEEAFGKISTTLRRMIGLIDEWQQLIEKLRTEGDGEAAGRERELFETREEEWQFLERRDELEEELSEIQKKTKLTQMAIELIELLMETERAANGGQRTTVSTPTLNVKLPKLEPIRFGGNPAEWPRFWEFFTTTVDNRPLAAVEKLSYLFGLLDGDAKKSVEGYELTEKNYPIMKTVLRERFGNLSTVTETLLNELNGLQPPGMNTGRLKQMAMDVDRIRRILKQQGVNIDNAQMIHIVESKLPRKILEILMDRKRAAAEWTAETMCEKLNEIVKDFEEIDRKCHRDPKPPERKGRAMVIKETQKSAMPQGRQKWPCLFCDMTNHMSRDCKKYPTVEDKKKRLMERKRCFRCLKDTHFAAKCEQKCRQCDGSHHWLICGKAKPQKKKSKRDEMKPDSTGYGKSTDGKALLTHGKATLLPTVEVMIGDQKDGPMRKIPALLDSGSESTFLTEKCARELQLELSDPHQRQTEVFGGKASDPTLSWRALVRIRMQNGSEVRIPILTIPQIVGEMKAVRKRSRGFEAVNVTPQMLIGADQLFQLVAWKSTRRGPYTELETKMGPVVVRNDNNETWKPTIQHTAAYVSRQLRNEEAEEAEIPKTFWDLETLGITDGPEATVSDQIQKAFDEKLAFENGRYIVNWLWNGKQNELETNLSISYHRLRSLMRRFEADKELRDRYQAVINEQLKEGIIEKVTQKKADGIISYIPHQAVITPQKSTTKLRIVYDASAKPKGGLSLNDCMHDIPPDLPQLVGLLMRFRVGKYAVISDLAKAFLQIGLHRDQRDAVRFLLPKNWEAPFGPDNLQVYRFTRVCFGVTCSPTILAMTLKRHLQKFEEGNQIYRHLYVDNLIQMSDDKEQLEKEAKKAKEIFGKASFNLREQYSNYRSIMEAMNEEALNERSVKILGINWNFETDKLSLKLNGWRGESELTKRTALSFVASAYDPVGYMAPAIVPFKLFIQNLWKEGFGWDDALTQKHITEWAQLSRNWGTEVAELEIERFIAKKSDKLQLHIFADASSVAYGGVAYLRRETEEKHDAQMFYAKSRLAPIEDKSKTMTIPRLELMGILCAVRMAKFIQNEMENIQRIIIWSDSMVALQQILVENEKAVFVKNRVKEISEHRDKIEFRHVPTEENPADLLSRGIEIKELIASNLWWKGPEFIRKNQDEWPSQLIIPLRNKEEESAEAEQDSVFVIREALPSEEIIPVSRIGTWRRLLGIGRTILKAVSKFNKNEGNTNLDAAERAVVKQEQKRFPPSEAAKRKYRLYEDENGIWRVHTRLEEAELDEFAKYPMWLPVDSPMTSLIIQHYHEANHHQGANSVTQLIRKRFWISFRAVKTAVKRCKKCAPMNAQRYPMPVFAPLPHDRVTIGKPFEATGLDIMGPLRANDADVYVLLFTCLRIRAVHLEALRSTKTEEILRGIQKFIARRGIPSTFLSDNAQYFVAAAEAIHGKYAADKDIDWQFITPRAPWRGGVYERMNRNIKEALKRTFGRGQRNFDNFDLLLTLIEGSLNERPLLAITEDPEDHRVLRPVDFLRPGGMEFGEGRETEEDPDDPDFIPREKLIDRLRKLDAKNRHTLDKMWERWKTMYLPSLTERSPQKGTSVERQLKIGELVLIEEEEAPRSRWKLGRIQELIASRDGITRTATVRLPGGKSLKRAVNSLFPLEIGGEEGEEAPATVMRVPEKVEPRTSPPQGKYSLRRRERIQKPNRFWALLCLGIALLPVAMAQSPMICHGLTPKMLWRIPQPHRCHWNQLKFDESQVYNAIVFKPNNVEYHSSGFHCKIRSTTVTQYTELSGVEKIDETDNEAEELTQEECYQMMREKRCRYGPLKRTGSTYQTGNVVPKDVPGIIWSLAWGPTRAVKRNCFVTEISVFAHHGNPHAITPMADLKRCPYTSGHCHPKVNEQVIWRVNDTQRCRFLPIYKGKVIRSGPGLVIDALHLLLTHAKKTEITPDCGHRVIISDQGFGHEILVGNVSGPGQRTKPSEAERRSRQVQLKTNESMTPHKEASGKSEDSRIGGIRTESEEADFPAPICMVAETPGNAANEEMRRRKKRQFVEGEVELAELQYIENTLYGVSKRTASILCGVIDEHAAILNQIVTTDPTKALRKALKRENLKARSIGEGIAEVEWCHSLESGEYTLLPNPHNCSIPVMLKKFGKVFYLDRGTHELHSEWHQAAEEYCGAEMTIALSGGIWKYNRDTGYLTPNHQNPNATKTEAESWDFLNHQAIMSETSIHDITLTGFQEEIIEEMEKAATAFSEGTLTDQTYISPTRLQDEIQYAVWESLLKKVWIAWITAIAVFITITIGRTLIHFTSAKFTAIRPATDEMREWWSRKWRREPRPTMQFNVAEENLRMELGPSEERRRGDASNQMVEVELEEGTRTPQRRSRGPIRSWASDFFGGDRRPEHLYTERRGNFGPHGGAGPNPSDPNERQKIPPDHKSWADGGGGREADDHKSRARDDDGISADDNKSPAQRINRRGRPGNPTERDVRNRRRANEAAHARFEESEGHGGLRTHNVTPREGTQRPEADQSPRSSERKEYKKQGGIDENRLTSSIWPAVPIPLHLQHSVMNNQRAQPLNDRESRSRSSMESMTSSPMAWEVSASDDEEEDNEPIVEVPTSMESDGDGEEWEMESHWTPSSSPMFFELSHQIFAPKKEEVGTQTEVGDFHGEKTIEELKQLVHQLEQEANGKKAEERMERQRATAQTTINAICQTGGDPSPIMESPEFDPFQKQVWMAQIGASQGWEPAPGKKPWERQVRWGVRHRHYEGRMPVVRIWAYGPEGRKWVPVNILMDTGARGNFVDSEWAAQVGVEPTGEKKGEIALIGETGGPAQYPIFVIKVAKAQGDPVQLRCLGIPNLTGFIPSVRMENYELHPKFEKAQIILGVADAAKLGVGWKVTPSGFWAAQTALGIFYGGNGMAVRPLAGTEPVPAGVSRP